MTINRKDPDMGFKDAALPAKERALADRIVEGVSRALAEDRLIRTGQAPETHAIAPTASCADPGGWTRLKPTDHTGGGEA